MAVETNVSPVQLITAARTSAGQKIAPDIFITDHTFRVLSLYRRFKSFGILDNPTSGLLQAFEVIQNAIDRIESKKLKALKGK